MIATYSHVHFHHHILWCIKYDASILLCKLIMLIRRSTIIKLLIKTVILVVVMLVKVTIQNDKHPHQPLTCANVMLL